LLAAPRPAALRLSRPAAADWQFTLQKRVTLLGRRGGALPVDVDLSPFDPHGYISRNHARITWYRGRHHAIDLGSANGTYVNEHRLVPHRPELLRPGDCLRLGRVELLFGRL
jgi:pSer/pThr/pTyr-binding forkhead associated (FHA) protein